MRRSGSVDPRVADIVQDAGLTNQAFYRHFRGKDELLLAVLEDGQRRLVSTLERRMARAAPARSRSAPGSKSCSSRPATRRPPRHAAVRVERRPPRGGYPEATASQRERVVAPLRDAVEEPAVTATATKRGYALTMGSPRTHRSGHRTARRETSRTP